jgi:SAM-dependent methyltransferase
LESTILRRMTDLEKTHWWFREKRHILAKELRKIGTPGRALDIGAAGGGNTAVLREFGWTPVVGDLSETAVEIARSRGFDAVQADVRDLPWEDGEFDLVTAFEVLEHVEDDGKAAAECFRVLKAGGHAVFTVPADMKLWSSHDVAVNHVRRYERDEFRKLLEGAGFVVDTLWSWNVVLRPAAAWHRKRRAEGSDIDAMPNRVLNACLSAAIRAERYLPVKSLPGVSLIATAHKL